MVTAAHTPGRRVSMNPATFVQGARLDDVDVNVLDARWCIFDYKGKADPALCLGIQHQTDDGKLHEDYLSAGDMEYFRPSLPQEDGTAEGGGFLVPIKEREGMSSSTNAAIYLNSLVAAGYPVGVLDGNNIMAALVGLRYHINQLPQPKRSGLVKKPGMAGQPEREKTTTTVSRILVYPPITGIQNAAGSQQPQQPQQAKVTQMPSVGGLGNRQAQAPATATAPVASAAAPVDAELDALCADTIISILAENGGSIPKKDVATAAFRALANHPRKKEAVPRVFSDSFLSQAPGVRYDGVTVTLG